MNPSIFRDQLIDLRGAIYNPGQQVEVNVNGQWRPAQIQNLESYTVRNFFTRENTNRPPNQVFPEGGNPNANGENTNLIPGRSVLFQGPDPETRVPGTIVSKNYIVQIDGRTETVPHVRLKRATAQPQATERLANEEFYRQMREIAANPNVPPRPAAPPGPRAGVAFEVHNAFDDFKAKKWDKFIEIINRTTGTNTNFRNRNAPLQPLIDYVNTSESYTPEKKADIIEKINRIFTQIQGYSNYNGNIDNITNCIQYILMQSPDFIDAYINTFVIDCFKAYNSRTRQESCVKGMYERIYLAFRDTVSTLCLDQIQGVSAAASLCKPEYIEIYDCFYETLPQELLNDFSSEWYKESGDEELGKLTPEARIEDFIGFVKGRMNDEVRFSKAEASIRRYANKEINILFGGRRSSRSKRSVRKNSRSKRSLRKNKTNKRRNSKRRKSRKY